MNPHRLWLLPAVAGLVALSLGACSKTPAPAASTPPATTMAETSDADVTTRVKTALLGDAALKAFDLAVVTTKGDVRMTGMVDTAEQVDRAKTLARAVAGVNTLQDELTVKKP